MARFTRLPDPIVGIILLYEGSIVKSYLICLLRRLTVRSYQSLLTREFTFSNLPYYSVSHLAQLVHTEMYTVQRFPGLESTRVYRKCLKPWLPLVHLINLRNNLHDVTINMIYGKTPGHPMYRRQTETCEKWLLAAKRLILGTPKDNPRSLRALLCRQRR